MEPIYQLNKKTPQERYEHFNLRLQQRYGIEITETEYEQLKVEKSFYKPSMYSLFCSTIIKSKMVYCIAAVRDNDFHMRTALPPDMKIFEFPKTHELRQLNVSGIEWKEFLIGQLKIVYKMKDIDYGTDKNLFTTQPRHLAIAKKYGLTEQSNIIGKVKFVWIASKFLLLNKLF